MIRKQKQLDSKNDTFSFPKVINEISLIVKKNHLNYLQLKYVFKEVRKKCDLKSIKSSFGQKDHLSIEEFNRLVNSAYLESSKDGFIIKILLFSGARVNEFVNIKISDIYIFEKKIYLSTTKGDKPRFVPIFDFLLHELVTYINGRTKGYLFESNRYSKYSTRRIEQILKKYVENLGINKKITPHRLRATIATWLSEKGMPTEQIQQFLGHSMIATTQIYTKGAVHQIGDIGNKLLGSGNL